MAIKFGVNATCNTMGNSNTYSFPGPGLEESSDRRSFKTGRAHCRGHSRCSKWTDGNVSPLPGYKENKVITSKPSAFRNEYSPSPDAKLFHPYPKLFCVSRDKILKLKS